MVSIAQSRLWKNLQAGDTRTYRTLRVVPLVGPSSAEPPYRLFDGGSQKDVKITELSEGGSVPEIRVENGMKSRVLLIDGQELIGAKQNRVLNVDVLVPAGAEVVIPVSCVEQGRWGYRSRKFSPGSFSPSSSRARKVSNISGALRRGRGYRSDQAEVWEHLRCMACCLDVDSPTMAMKDIYDGREAELNEFRAAVELPPQTVGVAVYLGERFLGFDLFDRASTFRHYWKWLIDSYAIDWLVFAREERHDNPGVTLSVDGLLETLATADWERYDAPGEGSTVRWEDKRCTASVLVWGQDSVVHLQAFPRLDEGAQLLHTAAPAVPDVPAQTGPADPPPPSVPQRQGERTGTRCERCGFLYGMVDTPEGDYCNHCGHLHS
jgi:hypothetical protein